MNQLQDLIAKMDAIEKGILSEATAPTTFTPTHFHKGNLGNKLPLMMTEPGVFWWEGGNQGGEGGMPGGSRIVPWQGNGENRSGWNPASVDGVIENGKYIDFPEGVTWKTYKPAVAPAPVTSPTPNKPKDDLAKKELLAKLQAAVQALQAAMSEPDKVKKEGYLSVARGLMESFGYNTYEGFNDSATDLINARQSNFNMNNGGELAIKQAERRAAQEAERLAAQKAASTATTVATNTAAPALAKVADQAGISAGEKVGATLAKDAAKTGLLKGAGKLAGKLMPGVGLAFGAKDAYDRYQQGDYLGAGLSGLSGVASLVPGIGTAASIGLDATNLARDYKKGQAAPAGAEAGAKTAQVPPGGDPKVFAIQQKLAAKGAKNIDGTPLALDGKMGTNTQAAMKKYGVTAESLAEGIRTLQERLALIEAKGKIRDSLNSEYVWDTEGNVYTMEGTEITDPLTLTVIWESVSGKGTSVQLDEFVSLGALKGLGKGAWDLGKSAVKGAGEFVGGIGGGAKQVAKGGKNASAAVTKVADKAGGLKGAGLKTGAALARNPIKTALGAAALGGAAGYGLTNAEGPATPAVTTTDKPTTTTTTTTDKPSAPEQGGFSADSDLKALIQAVRDAMAPLAEYDSTGNDMEINKSLQTAQTILDMAEKKGGAQTAADAANAASMGNATSPTDISLGGKPAGPEQGGKPNTTGLNAPKLTTGNGPTQIPSGAPDTKAAADAVSKAQPAAKGALIDASTGKVASEKDADRWGQAESVAENSNNELARWLKIARG